MWSISVRLWLASDWCFRLWVLLNYVFVGFIGGQLGFCQID